jgi:hypothetical protein
MAMSPKLLRPRATGFNPKSISGLALWLDAKKSASVLNSISPDTAATNGQTVRRWMDQSGNSSHADQGSGTSQPTYTLPTALDFDGTNDTLEIAKDISRNRGCITIFVVFTADAVTSSNRWLVAMTTAPGNVRTGLSLSPAGQISLSCRRVDGGTFAGITGSTISVATKYVVTAQANYAGQSASVRANGTSVGSSSSFLDGGNTSDTDSLYAHIGSLAASQFFDGTISEVLIYNGAALSASQVSVVEKWLGTKHSVAVA